jgi:pimeloyl-ACP methyl ester carboxylesterase
VAFARSLVSDLALDVLLYLSDYRDPIMTIVLQEANRILGLFKKRNPEFKGKVHLVGHSLGSAILFDLLCRQREERSAAKRTFAWGAQPSPEPDKWAFNAEIDHFYCLGSPVGLFQMLQGR